MGEGVQVSHLMFFFLGDKFNGSICFDIRGQHGVLKVNFEVIRVSKR